MTDTYAELLDDLKAAVAWFESLDLSVEAGRFGENRRFLQGFVEARATGCAKEFLAGRAQELVSTIPEAYELAYVHKQYANASSPDLKKRLVEMLKGPVLEAEEQDKNIIGCRGCEKGGYVGPGNCAGRRAQRP